MIDYIMVSGIDLAPLGAKGTVSEVSKGGEGI